MRKESLIKNNFYSYNENYIFKFHSLSKDNIICDGFLFKNSIANDFYSSIQSFVSNNDKNFEKIFPATEEQIKLFNRFNTNTQLSTNNYPIY